LCLTSLLLTFSLVTSTFQPSPSCLPGCRCVRDEVDCTGVGYSSFPLPSSSSSSSSPPTTSLPTTSSSSSLNLNRNNITFLSLNVLQGWPRLVKLELMGNRIKSLEGLELKHGLQSLDLSNNHLQILHAFVLTSLPKLERLNISHNNIHTISQQALYLPNLRSIDLSHNNLQELPTDLVQSLDSLRKLFLSNNRISRLLDGGLSHLSSLSLLDLSNNSIMDIEAGALLHLNISYLDLSFNSFRRIPAAALQSLVEVQTLLLDGLHATDLRAGAVSRINVKFLSISHSPTLRAVYKGSVVQLRGLETLTINNNVNLIYFHPGAVASVPNLLALDLTRNGLTAMEDVQPYIPRLRTLFLAGNRFKCHCGLGWLQRSILERGTGFTIRDGDQITCGRNHSLLSTFPLQEEGSCGPYILPLFPTEWEGDVGTNLTWLCRIVGSSRSRLEWELTDGTVLREGECSGRVCIAEGVLTISYLHPEDRGQYTCKAEDNQGQDTRTVNLDVKMLHIQIFPLTVADTFVTLSWNTSRSLARDFVLQVQGDHDSSEPLEFGNIEVGLKMSSYTISNLEPSKTYKIRLCMKKGVYTIGVSSTIVKTQPEHFMEGLGIVTDYTSIILVSLVLVILGSTCCCVSCFRLYKLRCLVESDTISTKQIISSGSEPSSIAGLSNHVMEKEKSRLVENELLSPTEDLKTMESIT